MFFFYFLTYEMKRWFCLRTYELSTSLKLFFSQVNFFLQFSSIQYVKDETSNNFHGFCSSLDRLDNFSKSYNLKVIFIFSVEGSRLKCTLLVPPCPTYRECFIGVKCFSKTVFWGNIEGQCCCEENSRKTEFVLKTDQPNF